MSNEAPPPISGVGGDSPQVPHVGSTRATTYLAILGIALGATLLLLSLGARGGLLQSIDTVISRSQDNLIRVARVTDPSDSSSSRGFTSSDLDALRSLPEVALLAAEGQGTLWTANDASRLDLMFRAVSPEYFVLRHIGFVKGRAPLTSGEAAIGIALDETSGQAFREGQAPVPPTAVGPISRQPFLFGFGGKVAFPAEYLEAWNNMKTPPYFKGVWTVVGTAAPMDDPEPPCVDCVPMDEYFDELQTNRNYSIYVVPGDLPTFLGRYTSERVQPGDDLPPITELRPTYDDYVAWVRPEPDDTIAARTAIAESLESRHPGIQLRFDTTQTAKSVYIRYRQNVAVGLAAIGLTILLAAAANTANMCASWVLQRVREFGVRRACGATRWSIQWLVLRQALMVFTVGTVLAAALALLVTPLVSAALGLDLVLGWRTLGTALGIIFLGAVLSSLYPAWVASRIVPASAMRGSAPLARARLREGAAVVGMVLAVAALVVGGTMTSTIAADEKRLFLSVGSDLLVVRARDPFTASGAARVIPTFTDIDRLSGVTNAPVGGWIETRATVASAQGNAVANLVVAGGSVQSLLDFRAQAGRLVPADDEAVIGAALARRLFGSADAALGQNLQVANLSFKVAGVLQPRPESSLDLSFDRDTSVLVSASNAPALLTRFGVLPDPILVVGRSDGATGQAIRTYFADRAEAALAPTIRAPGSELSDAAQSRLALARLLLTLSGFMVLTSVGGVAIIMASLVWERRREIGLRRAVGATRAIVSREMALHAVTLCLVGGAIGGVIGVAGGFVMGTGTAPESVVSSLLWVLIGLAAAGLAGLAAGLWPATMAGRLPPMTALRD